MRKLVLIFALLAAGAVEAQAACNTTACTQGETGTCRVAASCSQTDVQACVTASAAGSTGATTPNAFGGDGIYVPSGSCSWGSAVSWTDKNIEIIGSVGGTTTLTHSANDAFDVSVTGNGATAAAWRISGFTFTGSTSGDLLNINVGNPNMTAWAGFFRVDHITYNYSSSGNVFIIYGPVWGLFDHITGTTPSNHFEQADFLNLEYTQTQAGNYSEFLGEYSGRLLPMQLGTQYADYIEDSTFSCPGNYSGAISDSESGGQRMVFRHNTLAGTCFHYAHWTRNDEWDGHKFEIYNNSYDGGVNGAYPMRFESGTGVIFNNTFVNYPTNNILIDEPRGCGAETGAHTNACDGTGAVDGNAGDASAPGWPCAGQVGTGSAAGSSTRTTMNSIPLLIWNNGTQPGCSTGGACTNSTTIALDGPGGGGSCTRTMANYLKATAHTSTSLNGAIDYCQGAAEPGSCGIYTNTYTPYIYPNPLQGGGGTPAGAPAIFAKVVRP